MKTCLLLAGVDQWVKQGAAAPMSNEVSAHLGRCERCAGFAQSVQRTYMLALARRAGERLIAEGGSTAGQ